MEKPLPRQIADAMEKPLPQQIADAISRHLVPGERWGRALVPLRTGRVCFHDGRLSNAEPCFCWALGRSLEEFEAWVEDQGGVIRWEGGSQDMAVNERARRLRRLHNTADELARRLESGPDQSYPVWIRQAEQEFRAAFEECRRDLAEDSVEP